MHVYKRDAFILLASVVLAFLLSSKLSAQTIISGYAPSINLSSLTSSIPCNKVYNVHEDIYGYLWLTTENGFIRYDGKQFKIMSNSENGLYIGSGLWNNENLVLHELYGNIHVFDLNYQLIKIISIDSQQIKSNLQPVKWQVLYNDSLYLYLANYNKYCKLYKYKNNFAVSRNTRPFLEIISLKFGLNQTYLEKIYNTKNGVDTKSKIAIDGNFLFLENNIYEAQSNNVSKLYFEGNKYGVKGNIIAFVKDADNLILAIRDIGVIRLKHYFGNEKPIVDTLLNEKNISHLCNGANNRLWISTLDNGLFLINTNFQNTYRYSLSNNNNKSLDLFRAQIIDNKLWVMPRNKNDIGHIAGSRLLIENNKFHNDGVVRLLKKWNNDLFVIENNAIFKANNLLSKNNNTNTNQCQTPHNQIDIPDVAFTDNRVYKPENSSLIIYDAALKPIGSMKFIDRQINSVSARDSNRVYLGFNKGCAFNNKLLPYLSQTQILRVRVVDNVVYWATHNGVFIIPEKESFDKTKLVNISNFIANDIVESDDFVYMYNEGELIQVDKLRHKTKLRIRVLQSPFNELINNVNIDNDYLVVTTNKQIFTIPIIDIESYKHDIPKLYFIDPVHHSFLNDSVTVMDYKSNFNFILKPDIVDFEHLQYTLEYRVIKDNKVFLEWTNCDVDDPQIGLLDLRPANYTIDFRARCIDNEWETSKKYYLKVKPLWWQTTWFNLLCGLIIVGLIMIIAYFIKEYYKEKSNEQLAKELRLFELESKNTLAQLKPHFLFNAIIPIQGYLINNDKYGGLEYIKQFSKMLRNIILGLRNKYVSIAEEAEFLNNYLFLQQKRFNNNLSYKIRVSENIEPVSTLIPTMLLQPFVENAIEHGLDKNSPNQEVDIQFDVNNECIQIVICDNGRGLPDNFTTKQNHAIEIIREQINIIKQKTGIGNLHIQNNITGGVSVIITLPKQKK